MPLEEPDIATAGTGAPDHDGQRPREQRVALLASTVLLVILAVAAVVAITWGPDQVYRERTTAERATGPSDTEVAGTSIVTRTTTTTATSTTPGAGPASAPTVPAAVTTPGPNPAPPPPNPASAPEALPPGVPVVSVGPAGPDGCAASWTVADGGAPIVEYRVTNESAPAPPGPDGVEIGTALRMERTTATTGTVDPGGTLRVSAHNAIGAGPTSDAYRCN